MILHGDCIERMRELPDNSVDAIVTDPPYGLAFMGKKWDYEVPSVDVWRECLRVLKPGGHLLSFAGTRTQHRMAVNIEDAGFEIRDMIAWVYGSGFPKSLNIGKKIDQIQGNEREVVGYSQYQGRRPNKFGGKENGDICYGDYKAQPEMLIDKGTSAWEGWGTALKPAIEPITLARKPLDGTVAENCLRWGVGGLNIDASRVEFVSEEDKKESTGKNKHAEYKNSIVRNSAKNGIYNPDNRPPENYEPQGRFPANLIHDGSEEVRECFPETTKAGNKKNTKSDTGIWGGSKETDVLHKISGDNGGNASRFFKSIIYQPKASKAERGQGNGHPTVKPLKLMGYLIKMITPAGGVVLDPFAGSGTTGIAAKRLGYEYILIEREAEYIEIAKARIDAVQPEKQLTIQL